MMKGGDATVARLVEGGIVAIVRLREPADLLRVAEAVRAGGITAIEFTMTTPGALEVLATATARLGQDVVLGAGTVLDPETARAAILAGARFVVAPTLSEATIRLCRRYDVPVIPGAFTPTEILRAHEAGAAIVKVFPATVLGPGYLRDVLAPLPQVRLLPTGGVDEETAGAFIKAGAVAVAVGSNLVDGATVARGDMETISRRAARLVEIVRAARGAQ
jgi:2-dehydro-3-deoxyphosphogluconate aldolase/(4S)-4-hydroxy-2-oxoglutarate aldolase